jgi:hypothetical protein
MRDVGGQCDVRSTWPLLSLLAHADVHALVVVSPTAYVTQAPSLPSEN